MQTSPKENENTKENNNNNKLGENNLETIKRPMTSG